MRIQDVYRLALARGLTAKQAGAEYRVNHQSLAKCKGRYNLPSLISEYEKSDRESFARMSDKDLISYIRILKHKNCPEDKQFKYANEELVNRQNK
jgi:hypothetical protein